MSINVALTTCMLFADIIKYKLKCETWFSDFLSFRRTLFYGKMWNLFSFITTGVCFKVSIQGKIKVPSIKRI